MSDVFGVGWRLVELEKKVVRLEKAQIALARHVKRMDNEVIQLIAPRQAEFDINKIIEEYLANHPLDPIIEYGPENPDE